jgi:hypothetical protein
MSSCLQSCVNKLKACWFQSGEWVSSQTKKTTSCFLSKVFYAGYNPLTSTLALSRREALVKEKQALPIICTNNQGVAVDALYIPSQSAKKTGNVILMALNTSYQDHHPRHYEHYLQNGADVVLWNPTALKGKQVAEDLTALLKKLKSTNPVQKIVVKTYCASAEPGIAAVAALDDPDISLIVDRGYGDIGRLVRSFTFLSQMPLVKRILREQFACNGLSKVKDIKGRVLFVAPALKEDQMMHWKGRNLTYELFESRLRSWRDGDELLLLKDADHWTPWNAAFCNQVNEFLKKNGIIAADYTPVSSQVVPDTVAPSCFKRYIVPVLSKGWC